MSFEELKKRLLELAKGEAEKFKEAVEEEFEIKLSRPPVEIVDIITIRKRVGAPPFTDFEEITDIEEARNAILGITAIAHIFGRDGVFSFKCFSTEELELMPIEEPDVDYTTIYARETIDKKKPKKEYWGIFERVVHTTHILLMILERILKLAK